MESPVLIERTLDLPRVIVWDALVDPQLVEGWLHPTERLVGGAEPIEYRDPDDPAAPAILHVRSAELGEVRIELAEIAGGTRGTSTRLALMLAGLAPALRPQIVALWQVRLDLLENLLRGHPVVWADWERDHGEDFAQYLRVESGRAAQ